MPFSEGILIFDEVKVGLKLLYHAKTGKLLGLAMTADELGSLHDVYQTFQPDHRTQKALYVLQYLWRCTASDFDILGPYYTAPATMSGKFILATLFDTMDALQLYGFKTKATVSDGASTNLLAIKLLTGFGSGAFGNKPAGSCQDIHEVKAWFTNPYTNEKVFTLICPSHQVCPFVCLHLLIGYYILCFRLAEEHGSCTLLIERRQDKAVRPWRGAVWLEYHRRHVGEGGKPCQGRSATSSPWSERVVCAQGYLDPVECQARQNYAGTANNLQDNYMVA